MLDDDEWDAIRPKPKTDNWLAFGALRVSLLFGALVVAIALLIVPLVNPDSPRQLAFINTPGIDPITTATVRKPDRTYVLRQSVLQSKPTDVCVIRPNGTYSGAC